MLTVKKAAHRANTQKVLCVNAEVVKRNRCECFLFAQTSIEPGHSECSVLTQMYIEQNRCGCFWLMQLCVKLIIVNVMCSHRCTSCKIAVNVSG